MTGSRRVWLWWLVTRVLLVLVLVTVESGVGFDLRYYTDSLAAADTEGVGSTLTEYPVPAFLVLAVPYGLLALVDATASYPVMVIALMLAVDGAFLRLLLRASEQRTAALAWLVAIPALGPIAFARFDLVPGVLIGGALLALAGGRAASAGVLGALATGVKYWPALVLPALVAPGEGRRRVAVGVAATGVGLVAVSVAVGGWDRLLSPLRYQGARGLQIESVAATPAMLGWSADPAAYEVEFSSALAWEIDGPPVDALLLLSTVVTVLLGAALLLLWTGALRAGLEREQGLVLVVWSTLAAVGAFVVSGKVLSPQYLIWMLPAACAGLAIAGQADERRRLARWLALLVVAAGLTHVVYPHAYHELIGHSGWTPVAVGVLAARNLLLVGLVAAAFLNAARVLRSRTPTPSSHR